jgi:hypothetical protein
MADDLNLTGEEEDIEKEDERKPRRSSASAARRPQSEVRLEKKLIGGLKQLGGIVSRRNETLGEIIIEDSEKMGRLLARVAQTGPGPLKVAIGFVSELLEPLDAFGRLVGQLVRDWREARARHRLEEEDEQFFTPPISEE